MSGKDCRAGIYLSGTGNTEHCAKRLLVGLDPSAKVVALESPHAADAIRGAQHVVLGYPIQFSNAPVMVQDFISHNASLWQRKHVLCLATMGAFSGDGAGCAARILRRCGASIDGGLHLRMPDSVCDSKALKKSKAENRRLIERADQKIDDAVARIKAGSFPQDGLGALSHVAGLFGQRLWYSGRTRNYTDKLQIDVSTCIGCGLCSRVCPMRNIKMMKGHPVPGARCTMCYRCISLCPACAITLLGKRVVERCRCENYCN